MREDSYHSGLTEIPEVPRDIRNSASLNPLRCFELGIVCRLCGGSHHLALIPARLMDRLLLLIE